MVNTRKPKLEITAVLPVSRTNYLDQVLDALVNQTRRPDNLIVVFDGVDGQYLEVRNKVVALPFKVLCLPSTNLAPAHSIPDRRRHIVNIHNQVRELIGNCDFVWLVEDDSIVPLDALEKLTTDIQNLGVAMVTGVELGRWGIPYVGAWRADDVTTPTKLTSLKNKAEEGGVEEIDACGMYCALVYSGLYQDHEFYTSNGLGPDVNLGLGIRKKGFKNYINWSIHVTHLTNTVGEEKQIRATDKSRVATLTLMYGSTWRY